MKSHRETYPDQYRHPFCGKAVVVDTGKFRTEGIFERSVTTRFGTLAILEGSPTGYLLAHVKLKGNPA
jgi:hypothetical protein